MWQEEWESISAEPAKAPRVLVAIVPDMASWETVCRKGWYRIPLTRAPRRIGAEYLAFYHPKCFEKLRWTISYYASITRYSLVPRKVLLPDAADHPRADELYYRLDLGPLEALPQPIPSLKLRRVTFIQTDLAKLLQAQEIGDLWGREAPKQRLWRDLRTSEPLASYLVAAA